MMDLNKLRDWARDKAVSLNIYYSEGSDEYEVEVISAAKCECYYQKRVSNTEYFIENWEEHLNNNKENL